RNEQKSVETRLGQLTEKKGHSQKNHADVISKRDEINRQMDILKQEMAKAEKEYDEKERRFKKLKDDIATKRKHYQEEQGKLYKGYQSIEKLKSQEEMLEGLKEDFQGFFHGVKSILKARDEKQLHHIHGAIIELIDVPKEYVTAIETVLGGAAQHIVVEDDQSARNVISWLKKTNNGRATFLPLSSIKERFVTDSILQRLESHDGFVGIADDLVSVQKPFRVAVKHLMGHVLVAKTLKDANEIAKIIRHKYRVVTLEGDVVNPSGSVSGGARKKLNQSLFTREKDLETIKKKRVEYEQRAHTFKQKVNDLQTEIDDNETELEQLESLIEKYQSSIHDQQTTYRDYELKRQSMMDSLSLYTRDEKEVDDEFRSLTNREKELKSNLKQLSEQLHKTNEQIEALSGEEASFKDNQEELRNT